MTAQLVAMNREAVAMAADSAMSFSSPSGVKVYNHANKLFSLSKYAPVGIMVYGSAEHNGVPWETVIKLYREHLGTKSFATVADYGEHFLKYLDTTWKADEKTQETALQEWATNYLLSWRRQIDELSSAGIPKAEQLGRLLDQDWTELQRYPYSSDRSDSDIWDAVSRCRALLDGVMQRVFDHFGWTQLTPEQSDRLCWIILAPFHKETPVFGPGSSGVVISGFGDHEVFPVTAHFVLHPMVDDQFSHSTPELSRISAVSTYSIQPFAQDDPVVGFMDGVEREVESIILGAVQALLSGIPEVVCQTLGQRVGGSISLEGVREDVSAALGPLATQLHQQVEACKQRHSLPICQAVSALPKSELAELAESLVHLTSLKKRVSVEAETVGGPIDVAVISKGDGFIWIKRKHYFRADLNPQFFHNYNRHAGESNSDGP